MPAAAIDSLRAGRIPGETEAGPRLAAVLRFADSLHRQRRVPQEVFDAVAGQLDAAQLSELVGFCALAVSVALLLNVRDA